MNPFEEALINAILEEYSIPPEISDHSKQRIGTKKMETIDHCNETTYDFEMECFSLWVARNEKCIYLHFDPKATQFFFKSRKLKNTCVQMLTRQGYLIER